LALFFFIILETSITKGFRAAVVFDLGVIFSDVLFVLLAYFSSYQLLENLSNQPGLYVFGGTLLTAYGIITLLKKNKDKQDKSTIIPEKNKLYGVVCKRLLIKCL
jgi:threonine/homoserine/homoserine lactone efflux protein